MATARGYSLIEVIVAVLLFSIVATAVAQTIVWAQRARQLGENWMRATQLAVERIEAVRAGTRGNGTEDNGGFRIAATLAPVAGHRGLGRVDVVVSWTDSEPKEFMLSTLVRP